MYLYRLYLISIITTYGWSNSISGQIIDSITSEPIPNVNIYIKEIDAGTTSDKNGYFQINTNKKEELILHISHIGYKKKMLSIDPENKKLTIFLEETFYQMNDIVITGTRTPKVLKDVPIATEVINQNEIINSGVENLAELLNHRAGIYVSSSVQGGTTMNMMGMDSKYILTLIDGQPITGKFNSRTSLEQISISNIKKIEIIKGPSSSLYGSEAMGGVINIITKKNKKKYITSTIKYNTSENNFNPFNLNMGTRIISMDINNTLFNNILSIYSELKHVNPNSINKYSNLDNIKQVMFNSSLYRDLNSKQNIKFSNYIFYNNEESISLSNTKNITINKNSINILHNWKPVKTIQLQQNIRYGNYSRLKEYQFNDGLLITDDKTQENEFEYELSGIYHNNNSTINFGTELIQSYYSGYRIYNNKQNIQSISIYSQYDTSPLSDLNLILGIRADKNSQIKAVFSPRIAAMYTLKERWKLRVMWGKGFRMPSAQEKYFDWFHDLGAGTGYKVIGNSNLEPEKSEGVNLGLEYYHSNIYRVSLMFYQTQFDKMITDTNLLNNECDDMNTEWEFGCLSYINIDKVKYNGIELQGSFNLSNDWKTEWSLNWSDNIDLIKNESLPNTQNYSSKINLTHKLNNIPYKYVIQLKWIGPYHPMEYIPIENTYKTSEIKRKSQYYLHFYNTWEIKKIISIESGINNIMDQVNITYGPFIGRTYYIKLKYSYK